ncbi:hypothetical protein BD779DRAFT_302806 [Infundibulicybe gibba]|nr:hypothetical protein BD779DRAFT_302806 [Infundibulicybe gibba]
MRENSSSHLNQQIQCNSETCIFSPYHPRRCPRCTKTCWQYRQHPEQYSPRLNRSCPACAQRFRN